MKITYTNPTPTATKILDDVYYGTVFRPFGSRRVFMLTEGDGMSDYLAEICSELDKIVEEFSSHSEKWTNYEDLLLCVELDSGKVALISKYTHIEELEYEFLIKENQVMRFYHNNNINVTAEESWVADYLYISGQAESREEAVEDLRSFREHCGWCDCQVSNTIEESVRYFYG